MNDERKLNLPRLRRRIEEIVDREDQFREKALLLPIVRAAVELLKKRLTALSQRFRSEFHLRTLKETTCDPYTIAVEHVWSQIAYLSAGATMIQDSLVSGSLARSWLNLPPLNAVIIGASIGILLSVGWKFGVGTFAKAFGEVPRSARRKLEAITIGAFIVNFGLVCIVLLSRNPSESVIEYLVTVTGFATTLLGVTLPVLAGALLALAQDLDWSRGYHVKFERTTIRLAELEGFLRWSGEPVEDSHASLSTQPEAVRT
jgi:hypothetical protein